MSTPFLTPHASDSRASAREAIQRLGYNAVSARWKALFGKPARKIPLDAGFSCPNRDGTLSREGCAFCNAQGSGTGLFARGLGLAGQWELWRARRLAKWGDTALVAYLQSFSNTHGPAARLARVLDELAGLPGLDGLCLATRPDCLDREKTALLAAFPAPEFWLELGLQSANPETLARLHRGHDPEAFVRAAHLAASYGIKVSAHIIAGLPGEGKDDFLRTVERVNTLPVAGIKFHNLYLPRGTALARDYEQGRLRTMTLDEYLDQLCQALNRLRPDIVVHRLSADPAPGELLAPAWAGNKRLTHNAILAALRDRDVRQGKEYAP